MITNCMDLNCQKTGHNYVKENDYKWTEFLQDLGLPRESWKYSDHCHTLKYLGENEA